MWYSIVAVGPSGLLHSMRFPVELNTGVSEFSGFVAENYGGSSELKRTMMAGAADVLHVTGSNRLYLVEDWLNLMGWDKVSYQKLFLLGSTLSFTVDLSGVGCDCNAAVYLVQMDTPGQNTANYCDIQGGDYPRCTEIDLLEGNTHAMATTLHTREGTGADGTCNQDGCVHNLGKPNPSPKPAPNPETEPAPNPDPCPNPNQVRAQPRQTAQDAERRVYLGALRAGRQLSARLPQNQHAAALWRARDLCSLRRDDGRARAGGPLAACVRHCHRGQPRALRRAALRIRPNGGGAAGRHGVGRLAVVCARRWPGLAAGALRAVWRAMRSGRGDVQTLAPRRLAHTAAAHAAAHGPAAAAAALTTAALALAAAPGASERLRLAGHPAAAAAAARARWRGGVDAAAAAPHAAPATAAAGGPRWARRAGARQARDALTSRLQPSAPPGCSPVRPACNPVYQACSPNPPSLQPCAPSPATPCTTPPRAASRRWPRSYP